MSTWIVTIRAILQFLAEARKAKQELDEANEQMSRAAQALCDKWQGEASAAFAQDQGVGSEYMDLLQKTAQMYEDAETRATNAVKG